MEKMKLYGIKKNDGRAEFILEKSQNFIPFIKKFIENITGEHDWYLFDSAGEEPDRKIEEWTDSCEYIKYNNLELDIFVGKDRIILVTKSSLEFQKKIVEEIEKSYQLVKIKA